jgi:hypothetical protein
MYNIGSDLIYLLYKVTTISALRRVPVMKLKLSEPKVITFAIAVLLALLALIGQIATVPVLATYSFVLLAAAFVLLALGNLFKGI